MRLIDADKLELKHFVQWTDVVVGYNGTQPEHKHTDIIAYDISGAPTVYAIPIDWITKWAEKFYKVINGKRYYMGDGYDTIWDLLEDWERENQYGKN